MKLSLAFGLAAMASGIVSGGLWYAASIVSPKSKFKPLKMPENAGIISRAYGDGTSVTYINGIPQFTATEINDFVNKSGAANKWAAVASGVTSVLGGIASALSAAEL